MKEPQSITEVCLAIGCTIQDPKGPKEVTKHLKIEPTEIKWSEIRSSAPNEATEYHQTWTWKIHSPKDSSHPVAHRIHELLEVLQPIKKEIVTLPKCFWRHVSCLYHTTPVDSFIVGQAGLSLNTRMMKELIEYDLNVVYESTIWTNKAFPNLQNRIEPVG